MSASRRAPLCWLLPVLVSPAWAAEPALPVELKADRLRSTTDRLVEAAGKVELRQGGLFIQADRLVYRPPVERATASGTDDSKPAS